MRDGRVTGGPYSRPAASWPDASAWGRCLLPSVPPARRELMATRWAARGGCQANRSQEIVIVLTRGSRPTKPRGGFRELSDIHQNGRSVSVFDDASRSLQ